MPTRSVAKKTFVQAQDFAEFKLPRTLAVSPDGRLVAYTLQWCDLKKKKYFANLHVLDTTAGGSRQWTYGEHSDRAPVWSADGTRLAFLRQEKGLDCVYLISRDGGAPERVQGFWGSVASVQWAENDRTLIIKLRKHDPDPDAEKAISEGKEAQVKTPAVRKVTRLSYRLDGDGFYPEARWHLFKLRLDTKELSELTSGKADVEAFTISPDGSTVAYVQNIHRDPDLFPYHAQIILLNLRTKTRRILKTGLGQKDNLAFSPNGKYLVYLGHHNLQDAWGVEPTHPWLVDLKTGKERNLTPRFDRQANDETIGDLGYGLGTPFVGWSGDSKYLFYQVTDDGDTYLVRKNLRKGEPERVWMHKGQTPVVAITGKSIALVHLSQTTVGDIHYASDNTAGEISFRKLVSLNKEFFATRELGKVREVRFHSGDGTRLHGWLVLPPHFNPRRKYPAILEVHGGPRTQYGRVFFHEMQYLAAEGFVVFMTNPRGSQGYGKEFAGAITARWGTADYEDVMAAADWLEAQPFVDRKRVGITGGSYGGYMTNLCVGRSRRFRAAVTQRSVVDLASFVGTSDIGYHNHFEFGGHPWENPDGYAAMSPITYAANVRTPLLILHNEMDLRCSIEQAELLYAHIKLRTKTPIEFWRFPEEPHGMSRTGRPDRRVIRLEGIAGWFKKWMK